MKTNRPLFTLPLLAATLLQPWLAQAQQARPERGRAPQQVAPAPSAPVPVQLPPSVPAAAAPGAAPAAADAAPALPTKQPEPVGGPVTPPPKGSMLLNFQGASLTDVLNYLSEAAGFVIVQEAPVTGTVNVVSRQPVTPEEAVDLLNAVLVEKGYVAIRNGRILKIVSKQGAQKRDLPVKMGSDPDQIPRKDEMVTQILPLRYGAAANLVENLRPLLADNATISANDSSNSILLTDTQTNIRRIAQIIRAIDTSVASISTIHVYALRYADAKALAPIITQLFTVTSTTGNQNGRGGGGRGGFGGFGGGGFGGGGPGGGGGGGAQAPAPSEARQAASKIIAVADEQSNSLIVSAPEDLIPSITEVVDKIDTANTELTDTKIFHLEHADAVEMATLVTTLFADPASAQNQANNRRTQNRNGGGGGGGGGNNNNGGQNNNSQSERALEQATVVAVGDPRTNSLLVTAARDTMPQIAETVGRLDASDAKKQHVYVHKLENADADSVASVLRGMLGDTTASTTSQQNAASRLTTRQANGATINTDDASNSTGSGGRAGR